MKSEKYRIMMKNYKESSKTVIISSKNTEKFLMKRLSFMIKCMYQPDS